MTWNVTPQYISLIFVAIILAYSRDLNLVLTIKNRLFRMALHSVWMGILTANGYFYMIDHYSRFPFWIVVSAIYLCFLIQLWVPVLYFLYLTAVIYSEHRFLKRMLRLATLPMLVYYFMLAINPFVPWLFHFEPSGRLVLGPAYPGTWMLIFLYIFAMIIMVVINRKRLDARLALVLTTYPVISFVLIIIEYLSQSIVLSGTAATACLLIVYLFMQNKHIVMDALTGLPNRKAFTEKLYMNVNSKKPMQFILISLNDFKDFNDRYGTMSGDELLREISTFLRLEISKKMIYRYGGDEFVIMLEDGKGRWVADILNMLIARFERPWLENSLDCKLTVRFATMDYPAHAHHVEEIINTLEYAIEKAKGSGKNNIYRSNEETTAHIMRRKKIIEKLKYQIDVHKISVVYQPIYSVARKCFLGAELLMRMEDDVLGIVSPVEFIPIAEETGLIVELGYEAIIEACRMCRRLEERGAEYESISVNLSPQQIFAENFIERTTAILREQGIKSKKISFEITESIFIEKTDLARKIMYALIDLDFKFHLDDLGTGYSNLASVVELPFSAIKLDKSLLYNAIDSERAYAVFSALASSCSKSGMKIIVEGVETKQQQALVETISAGYMQGFLFARPMPQDSAIDMLGAGTFKWQEING